MHYLRSYSSTERLSLPNTEASATPIADVTSATNAAPSAPPTETPTTPPASEDPEQLQRDWKAFENAAKQHEAVTIDLTAADINALIAGSEARGQVSVSIENNIGRVRFSVPLNQVFMMDGRYLNGEATVQASPDGDPEKIRISNIVLSGQPVPDTVLDQGIFGWPSIRTLVSGWLTKQRIAAFRIENNIVTGETRGDR